MFVDAGGEELVSMVDELWLAHDGVFLYQAQSGRRPGTSMIPLRLLQETTASSPMLKMKQIKTQVQTDFCSPTILPLPPFLLYLGGSSMLHR